MANPSRDKGTIAETAVCKYLASTYWPSAERRRLHGALDKGDVAGTPGLCWEVKYAGRSNIQWWAGMREAIVERNHAKAQLEILVVKPAGVGVTRVGEWYAAMSQFTWMVAVSLAFVALDEEGHSHPSEVIQSSEPALFRKGTFWLEMMGAEADRVSKGLRFGALTLYPPGKRGSIVDHIKVMHLNRMVELLLLCGYGSKQS